MKSLIRTLWGAIAVLLAIGTLWIATSRWSSYEIAVERRALDARASELMQQALGPGSALACLDATASTAVEAACEKALFASPEAVAAAVAYIDAKVALLSDSIAHAERNRDYAANVERLRHGLEADRFGLVAQALSARGCTADACEPLGLFRNPWRIVTNLKQHTFDANVVVHASAWRPGGEALVATAPAATAQPPAPPAPGASPPSGVPVASKYSFPSAASIPPVSIMDAEPPLSKQEQAAIATPAPAPPATTGTVPPAHKPPAVTPPPTSPAAAPTQRRTPASRSPVAQSPPMPLSPGPAPAQQ